MPLPIRLALDIARDELHAVRVVHPPSADRGGAGAPLLLRTAEGLALPLWSTSAGAAEGASAGTAKGAAEGASAALGPSERPAPTLQTLRIDAADLRAKQELLHDALELGAALIVHDPRPGREPAGHDLVQRALNELLAERRASACL